jgi:hypothetical protein
MIDVREARLHLLRLKTWAEEKIQGGTEPPWAWYQYMKLLETTEAIIQSLDSTTTADSQRPAGRPGSALRLVDSNAPQHGAQSRPPDASVRLPM